MSREKYVSYYFLDQYEIWNRIDTWRRSDCNSGDIGASGAGMSGFHTTKRRVSVRSAKAPIGIGHGNQNIRLCKQPVK